MLKYPARSIETKRLLLQPYSIKWYKEVHELISKNKSRLLNSFPNLLKSNEILENTKAYILRKQSDWNKNKAFSFMLFTKDIGSLIGHFNIKDLNWRLMECELSYFIDGNYENQGLISEAITGVLEVCFLELKMNRVTVRIVTDNVVSIKVAEKSGLKYEGTYFKDFLTYDEKQIDTFIYGISKEAYYKKNPR